MKKIVVIGGVVIVAAAVISPYYAGKKMESRFEQKVAAINNKIDKYFHVKDFVKLKYNTGWFSSTAKTTIGDKIVINHAITHGPYCFLGLGRVQSSFEIAEKNQKSYEEVKAFFNGQEPYSITTTVSYGGTTHFNLHSPNIGEKAVPKVANAKIVWQGLDFDAKFTQNEVNSSFAMPKLLVAEEGKFSASIEGVKSQGTSSRFFDSELNFAIPANFKIDSSGNVDKIAISSSDQWRPFKGDIAINNITSQTKGENAISSEAAVGKIDVNLVNNRDDSNYIFSIDNIKLAGNSADVFWIFRKDLLKANWASKGAIDVANVKFNASQQHVNIALNYHQEQEILDDGSKVGYRELYKASDINAQVPTYNNLVKQVEFGYKIAGLPKDQTAVLLTNYLEFIKSSFMLGVTGTGGSAAYSQMMQYQNQLMQSGQRWAIASLQGTPSVDINFNLQGDKGLAYANFNASLVKPDTAQDPQQLIMNALPRVSAKLSVKASKGFVEDFYELAGVSKDQVTQLEQQVAERYPSVIKTDEYSVDVELKDGQLYVNGQLDPEFTQKVLSSFR